MGRKKKASLTKHIAIYILLEERYPDLEQQEKVCNEFLDERDGTNEIEFPETDAVLYVDKGTSREAKARLFSQMRQGYVGVLATFSIDMLIDLHNLSWALLEDFIDKQKMTLLTVKEHSDSNQSMNVLSMISIARRHALSINGYHVLSQFSTWATSQGLAIPDAMICKFLDEVKDKDETFEDSKSWEDYAS